MNVPFSPPFISEDEIAEVVDTLRSGWITTGPKTKRFEKMLTEYSETDTTVCLNSATAALEMTLRVLGIGAGDEVITCAYTYTASASVVTHVGATLKLVDCQKDNYLIDYDALENAITEKTKAIIPVDIAGVPCDYDRLLEIVNKKAHLFNPRNEIQKTFGRVIVITDGAHSLGAMYKGKKASSYPDFITYSFHAVKNLTTAEGGAVTWKKNDSVDSEFLYKQYQLLSLHGQSKDAFSKMQKGSWEYDVVAPFYKCNMTDIMASLGIRQLEKYDNIVASRHKMIKKYNEAFKNLSVIPHIHKTNEFSSSAHLYLLRFKDCSIEYRNQFIERMAENDIACNVHYKPLPMLTAYNSMGFDINNFPNAYNLFTKEISLPLFTGMTEKQQDYVIENFKSIMGEL